MKYTVLIYENAADFSARTDEKRKDAESTTTSRRLPSADRSRARRDRS